MMNRHTTLDPKKINSRKETKEKEREIVEKEKRS
jgi:hypothetical protein